MTDYTKVTTYKLTPEELAKYDNIKPIAKETHFAPTPKRAAEPRINKDRYMEMKEMGMTDREIQVEIKCHWRTLQRWKYQWGMYR